MKIPEGKNTPNTIKTNSREILRLMTETAIEEFKQEICPRNPKGATKIELSHNIERSIINRIENNDLESRKVFEKLLKESWNVENGATAATQIENEVNDMTFYGKGYNSSNGDINEDYFKSELIRHLNKNLNVQYRVVAEKEYTTDDGYSFRGSKSRRRIDVRAKSENSEKEHFIEVKRKQSLTSEENGEYRSVPQCKDLYDVAKDKNGKLFVVYIAQKTNHLPDENSKIENIIEKIDNYRDDLEFIVIPPAQLAFGGE